MTTTIAGTPNTSPAKPPLLNIDTSRHFPSWLATEQLSLAFTTYQAGKLFLLGLKADGSLSAFERTFERTMGLWSDGQTMWLSSVFQIWRLEHNANPQEVIDGFDRIYVPQVGYTTGDIDAHDLAVDADGRVIFVNTQFGCLATISDRFSFEPIWQPPFISRLAPEDRCHLNGMAMLDGRPKYVTACSQSDVVDGWRDHRVGGGVVIDVESNEIVCDGMSMPHSPRIHDDRLWLIESGTGFLGYVDLTTGQFERVTFCPGYGRGLTFHGDYAIVGLSKCRQERTFSGLPLDDNLRERQAVARAGLIIIDLKTGDIVHWLRLDGVIEELFDVVVLPGVVRPKALGFKTDEIRRTVAIEQDGVVTRWKASSDRSAKPRP